MSWRGTHRWTRSSRLEWAPREEEEWFRRRDRPVPVPRTAWAFRVGFVSSSLDAVCLDADTGDVAGTDALDDLVRLHHRRLVALAYGLCGNRTEAEDIVADAFA